MWALQPAVLLRFTHAQLRAKLRQARWAMVDVVRRRVVS
jgi:hypothetical protein